MWPLVTYSNCFEIVSTVAFLVSQTRLILGMFNTVILYHYTINSYLLYLIFAAPGKI